MEFEDKRVKVYRTHNQFEEDFEYEGKLLAINTNYSECIILCDSGKLTSAYVTLCKIFDIGGE